MAELIAELSVETVRANLAAVRRRIAETGRAVDEVEILAAVKYLASSQLDVLRDAGVTLLGENRAQELVVKAAAHPGEFTWDFIGALQSRKVATILPHVRYIHSVASDSALAQLERHGTPSTRVLVEVNVAGDAGKAGIAPPALDSFLERCPVEVVGLMTMPPLARSPEESRRHFAALRELSERHGLAELSMGTSQDFVVAVEEGATIVRLGTSLYESATGT